MEYILKGKYCKDCKIYAKTVEEKAYSIKGTHLRVPV